MPAVPAFKKLRIQRKSLGSFDFGYGRDADAISDLAHTRGLSVHMDGSRFANACAASGCSPADLTWRAGIDVLCCGGTKLGMAVTEAVVFFDRQLGTEFAYRCKQAGQLASKMRYLSAPWLAMLTDGTWLRHAAHANAMAHRLSKPLSVRLFPVPGLKAGDMTAFTNPHLCNTRVFAVP